MSIEINMLICSTDVDMGCFRNILETALPRVKTDVMYVGAKILSNQEYHSSSCRKLDHNRLGVNLVAI